MARGRGCRLRWVKRTALACMLAACGADTALERLPAECEARSISTLDDETEDGVWLAEAGYAHVHERGYARFRINGQTTRALHVGDRELGLELYAVRELEPQGWIADYCYER